MPHQVDLDLDLDLTPPQYPSTLSEAMAAGDIAVLQVAVCCRLWGWRGDKVVLMT